MRLPIISDALQAIAEGFDLAFEIMCPRDHSCEYRARKAREAQRQAAADALADAEAEREAWEANELFDRAVVGGQNFRTCPVAGVCAHKGFCDQLDDCCIRAADLNTSRAEGTQCADSSGEVGGPESPSPERPPSDLLYEAALGLEWFVGLDGTRPPLERCQQLVAELRDLAAQFEADESEPDSSVSHEDLAAHLTAVAIRANTGHVDVLIDSFTRSLLADYTITK